MRGLTFRRFASAADLLRPKTFFKTLARIPALVDENRELHATVERLRIRTEQLWTLQQLDREQHDDLLAAPALLDAARIAEHVRAAVEAATLEMDPFPHVVVNSWLPEDVYAAVIKAVPPAIFFADREISRQRLMVPFPLAPAYSDHVWRFVASHVIECCLSAALREKFNPVLREYVSRIVPGLPEGPEIPLRASDGRIMLRRPGYVIRPHRDPKWGFIVGLMYLARKGDNETYGTQLYRVNDDEEQPTENPLYIEEKRCTLVRSVPFRANTLLAFLNSAGAHGASFLPTRSRRTWSAACTSSGSAPAGKPSHGCCRSCHPPTARNGPAERPTAQGSITDRP
jgi:hypothetical protein